MPTSELDETPPTGEPRTSGFSGVAHKTTGTAQACASTAANLPSEIVGCVATTTSTSPCAFCSALLRLRSSATLSWSPLSGLRAYPLLPQIVTNASQHLPRVFLPHATSKPSRLRSRTSRPTRYWGFCVQRSPAEAILQAVALVSGLLLAFGHRSPESEMLLWVLCLCSVV